MDTGVAVLCGDRSRRMGVNKAFLKVDGKPLWQFVVDRLTPCGYPVHLVSKTPIEGCDCIVDSYGQDSPLSGVLSAFSSLSYEQLLFVPVDMPLVSPDLLHRLLQSVQGDLSAFCYFDKLLQPFPSLIHRSAASVLEQEYLNGHFRLTQAFMKTDHVPVDCSYFDQSFLNINTWGDWHRFLCIIRATCG